MPVRGSRRRPPGPWPQRPPARQHSPRLPPDVPAASRLPRVTPLLRCNEWSDWRDRRRTYQGPGHMRDRLVDAPLQFACSHRPVRVDARPQGCNDSRGRSLNRIRPDSHEAIIAPWLGRCPAQGNPCLSAPERPQPDQPRRLATTFIEPGISHGGRPPGIAYDQLRPAWTRWPSRRSGRRMSWARRYSWIFLWVVPCICAMLCRPANKAAATAYAPLLG
jgi:hypothetical protein